MACYIINMNMFNRFTNLNSINASILIRGIKMTRGIIKVLSLLLAVMLVLSLAACGQDSTSGKSDQAPADAAKEPPKDASGEKAAESITIKFASNMPDQTNGMGMLEKKLADNYMKENPNVKIEFELNDNETHRSKLKVYAASNNMPDMYMNWADPSALIPMAKGGYSAELDTAAYKDYNFLPGALEDCSFQDKLYGLPRNFDIWLMMYNKDIFEKNGVKIPATMSELEEAAKAFNAKGITPCVMYGKDQWNQVVLLSDLILRISGDQQLMPGIFEKNGSFAAEKNCIDAGDKLKALADSKFFQNGYLTADYNTAQNLFVQGKAAMYYIGSWELGMASNKDFPEEFKKNVRAAFFPTLDGAKDTSKDVIGRTGGIYSVNPQSKVKDGAVKFLNYMFKPENWAKMAWQEGVCTPAQKWDTYMTGNETELQKDITNIFATAKSTSGFMYAWKTTPAFQQDCLDLSSQLLTGKLTSVQYWQKVDESLAKNPIQ